MAEKRPHDWDEEGVDQKRSRSESVACQTDDIPTSWMDFSPGIMFPPHPLPTTVHSSAWFDILRRRKERRRIEQSPLARDPPPSRPTVPVDTRRARLAQRALRNVGATIPPEQMFWDTLLRSMRPPGLLAENPIWPLASFPEPESTPPGLEGIPLNWAIRTAEMLGIPIPDIDSSEIPSSSVQSRDVVTREEEDDEYWGDDEGDLSRNSSDLGDDADGGAESFMLMHGFRQLRATSEPTLNRLNRIPSEDEEEYEDEEDSSDNEDDLEFELASDDDEEDSEDEEASFKKIKADAASIGPLVSDYGACTLCAEEIVVNPVGCVQCSQMIGCQVCAKRWYDSVVKRREADGTSTPACPMCRYEWDKEPEVKKMDELMTELLSRRIPEPIAMDELMSNLLANRSQEPMDTEEGDIIVN